MQFLPLLAALLALQAEAAPPIRRVRPNPAPSARLRPNAPHQLRTPPPAPRPAPPPPPAPVARPAPHPAAPAPLVSDAPHAPPPPEIKWSIGAAFDLRGEYFPDSLSTEVKKEFGILNAEFPSSIKVGKGFLAKFRPTGHLDPNNPTRSEQYWYDLPEGYFQGKGALSESTSATVQLGFNTFTWGVTDGFNPLDVVSARRYSDPLRSEKLGAFSVLGRLDFGSVMLEGIFIPWQRRSKLPGEKSRWLPRQLGGPITYEGTTTTLPDDPSYTFGSDIEFDKALTNNMGARLSSHILGIDAAAYVFDGASSVPAVTYTLDLTVTKLDASVFPPKVTEVAANRKITLQPIYNRVTVSGLSAVFPVWELLVRGEFAITKAYRKGNSAITEKNTEAVAELEHTFSGEKSTFTLIGLATWANPQESSGTVSGGVPSFTRLFDQAVGFGFRWNPNETWQGEGYGFFDNKHGGSLYDAQLSCKVAEGWKVYLGGDVFEGGISQPIGVYKKNTRGFAGIKAAL